MTIIAHRLREGKEEALQSIVFAAIEPAKVKFFDADLSFSVDYWPFILVVLATVAAQGITLYLDKKVYEWSAKVIRDTAW